MPTRPQPKPVLGSRSSLATRARYTRTNGNLLNQPINNWTSDGGIDGPVWWLGLDSGGGATPIGPNGPYASGYASAIPAVTRAISLIVDPIAQSPIKVQEVGFGGQPLPTPRWLTDPMLTRPDARFTDDVYPSVVKLPRSKFYGDFIWSALCWGMGAFITQEDSFGEPLAGTMRLINPGLLSTERDDAGALHWVLGANESHDDRVVFNREGFISLGSVQYRICVLRNPHSPVDSEGMSLGVFAMNPQAFRLAQQIDQYSSGTFRSGVPSGYLKVNTPGLQQVDATDLKQRWMQAHGGDRRSIAVLNATTEFVPLSLSPVDAALTDVKTLSIRDVAYAFAIDPAMLGASMAGSNTYSNVRDYFRQHRDLGLGIWIAALEDVLTAFLSGSQGVRVDLDAFTRPEPKERYEAYSVAMAAGILTLPEVRAMEGLPPITPPEPPPPPAPPTSPTAPGVTPGGTAP